MNDIRIGAGRFFDRGIDTITTRQGRMGEGLPDMHQLLPTEQGARPQLERLLAARSMESFIDDSLCPHLEDRELLLPQRFRSAMKSALGTLRRRQERSKDKQSREAKVLARAGRLLDEEEELRELAHMYCSTLYQG